jgi:hypothetical protein
MSASESDVAEWMFAQLKRDKILYQEEVVHDIATQFGASFTYDNENGNLAISRKVLTAFKRVTGDSVIWERGERCWRFREKFDAPSRRQD